MIIIRSLHRTRLTAGYVLADSTTTPPICSWKANGHDLQLADPGLRFLRPTIDDLWHAAVNGRGTYFSATDPSSLSSGLASRRWQAINQVHRCRRCRRDQHAESGAGNNYAYVASYTTVKWIGNLEAAHDRHARPAWSARPPAGAWKISRRRPARLPTTIVADTSGSSTAYYCVDRPRLDRMRQLHLARGVRQRHVNQCSACRWQPLHRHHAEPGRAQTATHGRSTPPTAPAPRLIPFLYANLTSGQQSDFNAPYINGLSQWTSLTATQQTAAQGANLVNYLRGQNGYEDPPANYVPPVDNRLFRYREATMGDALESQPNYIGKPVFNYADPGYSAFVTAECQPSRHGIHRHQRRHAACLCRACQGSVPADRNAGLMCPAW